MAATLHDDIITDACRKLYKKRVQEGELDTLDQQLVFCLNLLCDDLFLFLKTKGQKLAFKKFDDPLYEMLKFVTSNPSSLLQHYPVAARNKTIRKHVGYLQHRVLMTRNEMYHHYSKAGEWSTEAYFSGYHSCFTTLYRYQHLLLVELNRTHQISK